MGRLRHLSRANRFLAALAVGGAVFGIATAVQASIPDSNGVAHGCYYVPPKLGGTQQLPGDLRLIDTDNGQHCNSNEGSVDLATTGYVQGHVNQTVLTGSHTFPFQLIGDHMVQWTCGGWVATNPTVSVDPITNSAAQAPITLHAVTNVESQNAGVDNAPFGTTVKVYFSTSTLQTI